MIARATISLRDTPVYWIPGCVRASSGARAARLRARVQLVPHELVRALRPVAQDRARVARVDDLLHAEALRGAERRGHRLEPCRDLLAQRRRVLRGLELAPVGRLEAAGHRQRPPVARRPREAQVEPRPVAVAR